MVSTRLAQYCLAILLTSASLAIASDPYAVDHEDPIIIDTTLKLSTVVELTLKNYPDRLINQALQDQAESLRQRGNSWIAGASNLSYAYLDDAVANNIGFHQSSAQVLIPLWNWDQRSAGQQLAEQAQKSANQQAEALKWQVAGLIRSALWTMAIENIRYQQAKTTLDISKKLLQKIQQRVDLGDLPRADYLLAKSDYLQKQALLTQAKAKLMHSRKSYSILTGIHRIPDNFKESLSKINSITEKHPALQAINALIKRRQAKVKWIKTKGLGQPMLQLGMQSEKASARENSIESAGVGFSIPFGGQSFLNPKIAQANVQLNRAKTQREHLYRLLTRNLHEAEHALQVNKAELDIAHELKTIAEQHLKMTELSFASGEINLLDLLKIQALTYNAIRNAKEREIQQQRNIALYNQAVGVQP